MHSREPSCYRMPHAEVSNLVELDARDPLEEQPVTTRTLIDGGAIEDRRSNPRRFQQQSIGFNLSERVVQERGLCVPCILEQRVPTEILKHQLQVATVLKMHVEFL